MQNTVANTTERIGKTDMKNNINVNRVIVLDTNDEQISTTWANRALKLVMRNKAEIVCDEPLTIRLLCAIDEKEGSANE